MFSLKKIFLPRQARDKYRKVEKEWRFFAGTSEPWGHVPADWEEAGFGAWRAPKRGDHIERSDFIGFRLDFVWNFRFSVPAFFLLCWKPCSVIICVFSDYYCCCTQARRVARPQKRATTRK